MEKLTKPVFAKDGSEEVFRRIRHRVNAIVRELEPERRVEITLKAILFPLLYATAFVTALAYGERIAVFYACYCLMGITLVFVFLNLIHEAVHNTLFKRKWLNALYIYFFDLMGANSFVWKMRHIRLHHNYPNIMGWDSDIEQSPLARVIPHGKFSAVHRYQHIYLPMLYPFFLLNWLLVRDFKDYFSSKRNVWKVLKIPRREYVKLFIFKSIFIFYIILLPKLMLPITWAQAIVAFCIMIFTASIIALIVLISPHANTENEFPLPDEENHLEKSWFLHQLYNTNDVREDNWFTRFFMGCFNYHVAHHLFPHVHHVFYPEVTKIIKEEASRSDLPYRSYPLVTTLLNHYRLLKQNRMPENIFDDAM